MVFGVVPTEWIHYRQIGHRMGLRGGLLLFRLRLYTFFFWATLRLACNIILGPLHARMKFEKWIGRNPNFFHTSHVP